MHEVLIRCPITKKHLSTGIALKAEVFAQTDFKNQSVYCPHCRQLHPWTKRDAFLWR
jgi:hypothetical protein